MFNGGGASQFNGNGFMSSPDAQAGGSAQKKNYDPESQSVRKLSIRQIYSGMEQQGASQDLIISGKPVVNVSYHNVIMKLSFPNMGCLSF
jgi:hypothetical protein